MRKFEAVGPDNNIYEFVFFDGRLFRILISDPHTLRLISGEYINPKCPDSHVSLEHFERCFRALCDAKDFHEYAELITELKKPQNNPEYIKIAKRILKEKRKALIQKMRQFTDAIKET